MMEIYFFIFASCEPLKEFWDNSPLDNWLNTSQIFYRLRSPFQRDPIHITFSYLQLCIVDIIFISYYVENLRKYKYLLLLPLLIHLFCSQGMYFIKFYEKSKFCFWRKGTLKNIGSGDVLFCYFLLILLCYNLKWNFWIFGLVGKNTICFDCFFFPF